MAKAILEEHLSQADDNYQLAVKAYNEATLTTDSVLIKETLDTLNSAKKERKTLADLVMKNMFSQQMPTGKPPRSDRTFNMPQMVSPRSTDEPLDSTNILDSDWESEWYLWRQRQAFLEQEQQKKTKKYETNEEFRAFQDRLQLHLSEDGRINWDYALYLIYEYRKFLTGLQGVSLNATATPLLYMNKTTLDSFFRKLYLLVNKFENKSINLDMFLIVFDDLVDKLKLGRMK